MQNNTKINPSLRFLFVNRLAGFIVLHCVLGGFREGFQSISVGNLGISMLMVKLSPGISSPNFCWSPEAVCFHLTFAILLLLMPLPCLQLFD